ncbi:MAG TPA: chemotaxis protein [bacterium]|nr:chemotaxis protein [bacterium]
MEQPITKKDGNGILLEAGTNELEVLIFVIGGQHYGINVAKVREIIRLPKMIGVPESHPAIDGMFELRGKIIPLINIKTFFAMTAASAANDRVVVCEFNASYYAFRVDEIRRIFRLSWRDIERPDQIMAVAIDPPPVTGVAKVDGIVVQMLDFEAIVAKVTPDDGTKRQPPAPDQRLGEIKVLLADDSKMMRMKIENTLRGNGLDKISLFSDGAMLWHELERIADAMAASKKPLSEYADLVITDIEMPQMDGLHLTGKIKSHSLLKGLPVVIYSSLITPGLREKCHTVGADYEVVKDDAQQLVGIIREIFTKRNQ